MRRAVLLIALLQSLPGSWSLAQDRASRFAGKWLRDDLVGRDSNHLPRVTWEITFDDRTMTRRESSEKTENARTFVYNLDGTDTSTEVPNRPGRQVIHKLKRIESKEIETTETIPGSSLTMVITEVWKITNKGNTLTVVRKFGTPGSNSPIQIADEKYSFQRVPSGSDR